MFYKLHLYTDMYNINLVLVLMDLLAYLYPIIFNSLYFIFYVYMI